MIYDTTFKNLIVDCFNRNTYNVRFDQGLLIVYSGSMPTYQNFVSDWGALYYFSDAEHSFSPIKTGQIQYYGTNLLCAYGHSVNDSNADFLVVNKINNEFYYDTSHEIGSDKYRDGTPGFAAFFPYARVHNYSQSANLDHKPFLLLSVSDVQGDGIVKLSTLDTTLSSDAPTLMSMEFEVNMGA